MTYPISVLRDIAMRGCPIRCLDEECLRAIFAHLPAQSLASAACVCREWRDVLADNAIWQQAHTMCDSSENRSNAGRRLPDIALVGITPHLTLAIAPHPTPPYHAIPRTEPMPAHLPEGFEPAYDATALRGWRQVCMWRCQAPQN